MRGLLNTCAGLALLLVSGVGSTVAAQEAGSQDSAEGAAPALSFGDAEAGMLGQISAWLLYSSEFGATGGVSGKFKLSSSNGAWFSLGGEVAERRQSAKLTYHQDGVLANGAALEVILRGEHQEPRDILPFEVASAGLEGRLSWDQASGGNIVTYLGYSQNDIYNPGLGLSSIIQPDLGQSTRSYVGGEYSRTLEFGGALSKLRYEIGGELAQLSGSKTQSRLRAQVLAGGLVAHDNIAWRLDLRAGALDTSGGASSIGERFILGGATLRGFGYGDFGPHDGAQALGGNRYAVARIDVQFPHAFGENTWLLPGLHADIGSLWGLDNTNAGLIDDSSHLRSSVGVTLATKMAYGSLSLSLSQVIDQEATDGTQPFQLRFDSKF